MAIEAVAWLGEVLFGAEAGAGAAAGYGAATAGSITAADVAAYTAAGYGATTIAAVEGGVGGVEVAAGTAASYAPWIEEGGGASVAEAGGVGAPNLIGPATTTPALLESQAATPGYGASSAGPGAADFGHTLANAGQLFTSPGNFFEQLGVSPGMQQGISRGASGLSDARAFYNAQQLRKQSDPFEKYRAGYGQQLQALEANPGSITSRPGYQAGLQAVQRGSAAGGYLGSGNEMAALAKYGGGFYEQEAARLAGLAGAGQVPGAGQYPASVLEGSALAGFGYTLPRYRRPGG